jgi:hypothetical protein
MTIDVRDVRFDTRTPSIVNGTMEMTLIHLPTGITVSSDNAKSKLSPFQLRRLMWDRLVEKYNKVHNKEKQDG